MISRKNRRFFDLVATLLLTVIVTSGLAIATPAVDAEAIPDPDPCELPIGPNPACSLPDPTEIIDPHDLPNPCDDPLGIICDPPDRSEIVEGVPNPCGIAPCEPALDPCADLGICDPVGDVTQLVNDTIESLPDPQVVIDEIHEVVENLPSDPCQDLGVGCEDPSDTINDAIYALVGLVGQLANTPCQELGYGCDPANEIDQLIQQVGDGVEQIGGVIPDHLCEVETGCQLLYEFHSLLLALEDLILQAVQAQQAGLGEVLRTLLGQSLNQLDLVRALVLPVCKEVGALGDLCSTPTPPTQCYPDLDWLWDPITVIEVSWKFMNVRCSPPSFINPGDTVRVDLESVVEVYERAGGGPEILVTKIRIARSCELTIENGFTCHRNGGTWRCNTTHGVVTRLVGSVHITTENFDRDGNSQGFGPDGNGGPENDYVWAVCN